MKWSRLIVLKELALIGALRDEVPTTTSEISEKIGISQQMISKRIIELSNEGYIERRHGLRKQIIKITKKGEKALMNEFSDYISIFGGDEVIIIEGRVESGMGEGRYYMSREAYMKQFKKALGYTPYPGTLNLHLTQSSLPRIKVLRARKGIEIKGFKDGHRTFGAVKCFKSKINDVEASVVMPVRSHYSEVIEVISRFYLRGKLGLSDGDYVDVEVFINNISAF